jgi:hypothetical protein
MSLKAYKPNTRFPGEIERTVDESKPAWPEPHRAKAGAPPHRVARTTQRIPR